LIELLHIHLLPFVRHCSLWQALQWPCCAEMVELGLPSLHGEDKSPYMW